MLSYWCDLAWLGGDMAVAGVLVEVDDIGIISSVTECVTCPPEAYRLTGLTLPGMANTHSHAFHRAVRGRTQAGIGSFWTWREQMYAAAARLDPDSYFRIARAAYGEMVLAGITCVGEFHYLHHGPGGVPYENPNAMGEALVAAAAEAGLRLTLLDTCYLHGGIGVELNEVQMRFSDGDGSSWASRAATMKATDLCRVGAAIHSVRAVDPATIELVAAWAAHRSTPLHAHVSEQPAENEQCLSAYGLTPVALLAERGALAARFTGVHATHATEGDIGLLGRSGSTVCICPTTERDLADGIAPARALRDAGATLTLGTDSHAVIDIFEEARAVELDERLASLVRGSHDAPSLLRAATSHGYDSLGWTGGGLLRPGAPADLMSVRLDSVRTAGYSLATALETVVFAANAADVNHVVVGGEVVVAGGRHRSIDVSAELSAAIGDLMGST